MLDKKFSNSESVTYERSNFRATRQLEGESVTDFITRLRHKAKFCKFDEYNNDVAIVDQFIETCTSASLRVKLLSTKDLTLETLISTALSRERAKSQAEDISRNSSTEVTDTDNAMFVKQTTRSAPNQDQVRKKYCFGCGSNSHVHGTNQCPAKNKTCHKCGKFNHFSSMCRSTSRQDYKPTTTGYNRRNNPPRQYRSGDRMYSTYDEPDDEIEQYPSRETTNFSN